VLGPAEGDSIKLDERHEKELEDETSFEKPGAKEQQRNENKYHIRRQSWQVPRMNAHAPGFRPVLGTFFLGRLRRRHTIHICSYKHTNECPFGTSVHKACDTPAASFALR